ncbi:MAG TPA: DUF167 domain-containing protein [candidate division WOR-3 bacterium]|uniref:DUF167 domain-containing protein n=1 Tax=candidate division WOR-3 bacterium TaxID=2052148 RepID=A0A7V0XE23_UNCW3|nr:DUF167 domain-containing protein [candidate division WOR-3 bacterium]
MRIRVTVRPGSRTEGIEERPGGPLLVKVRAPARDGLANEAVIIAVARHYRVPKSRVRLVRGHTGRDKVLDLPD